MGKILLVQPHRVLRHAIALSLFPEHEVETVESVPDAATAGAFDAVIVDGASLDEVGAPETTVVREVQSWKVPTIWVEDKSARAFDREKLVVIKHPIEWSALQSALAECLGTKARPQAQTRGAQRGGPEKAQAGAAASPVIDLVEIVDEAAKAKLKGKQD